MKMKKISAKLACQIGDFYLESNSGIRQYAFEKDFIICEAIKTLAEFPINENFRLVFCGGTCLSKAYGLLQRMSEDVDFKIVPTEKGCQLSRSALKKHLGTYVKSIVEQLEASGFGPESVGRQCCDEYKYSSLDVRFESVFDKPISLRPHILIELNFTPVTDTTVFRNAGALFDSLSGLNNFTPINIECVSLFEAIAEKLISFPRRLAMQTRKSPLGVNLSSSAGWDKALVRHLYDVCIILQKNLAITNDKPKLARLLQLVIAKDAKEFATQHPQFVENPNHELLAAVRWARLSAELKTQYQQFVADMVYAPKGEIPSFETCIDVFDAAISSALSLINQEVRKCKNCGAVPCICNDGSGDGAAGGPPLSEPRKRKRGGMSM